MDNKSLFERLFSLDHLMAAWDIVSRKNSSGGVDGDSVKDFEKDLRKNLSALSSELAQGLWKPQPYLRIEVPKKTGEKRKLGLLTVKDKIVQVALKLLIEPRFEKIFVSNSYAYRANKGALKAIRRVDTECKDKSLTVALRLDIDNFFDSIDHEILKARLLPVVPDQEIVRLIMLCVKMGSVKRSGGDFTADTVGIPQGAVISPLLSNLYLQSFDQSACGRCAHYIRYADDFVLLCKDKEEAERLLGEISDYLSQKLKLKLNEPVIASIDEGFEFLGIVVKKDALTISAQKKDQLIKDIRSIRLGSSGIVPQDVKKWDGIALYFGQILAQNELEELDNILFTHLKEEVVRSKKLLANRNIVDTVISKLSFLSNSFKLKAKEIRSEIVKEYVASKKDDTATTDPDRLNEKIIKQRKNEFHKLEGQNSEIIVSTPGAYLGCTKTGYVVKIKGKVALTVPFSSVKHITVIGEGVSLSSNLISAALRNKVSLDFFDKKGQHVGGMMSASSQQCKLWQMQSSTAISLRNELASQIVIGKANNQIHLAKYFYKYHKQKMSGGDALIADLEKALDELKVYTKDKVALSKEDFRVGLVAREAQCAIKYWAFVKDLLKDDDTGFEKREQQGAIDKVNVMLNYGYGILYARIWRGLLSEGLNPYDSVIHVRQDDKPTFVFDVIELFRAPVVDRIVFSLIQKKQSITVENGRLDEESRKLLAKSITERLQKWEKYRGEEITVDKIIMRQCSEIADFFTKGSRFKSYSMKW